MKIRSDFVTNSSSSSFILSFKDEASILSTLESQFPRNIEPGWSYGPGYLQQVLDDIADEANRYTKDEIEFLLPSEVHYPIWSQFICQLMDQLNISYTDARNYVDTDEGKAMLNTKCTKEIKSIMDAIGDDQIIVMIDHGDNGDGEDGVLEKDILPHLPCTKASFSHH